VHAELGLAGKHSLFVVSEWELACIDVKQIISGHSRLARHTSRNDDQVTVVESIGQLIWS